MDDKDKIEFDIELAQIGMRYGAFFAVGVAIFAIGATLLFTIYEHILLENQLVIGIGIFFLIFGVILTILASTLKRRDLDKLKKKFIKKTEEPKKCISYKNCLHILLLCKRYDGIER